MRPYRSNLSLRAAALRHPPLARPIQPASRVSSIGPTEQRRARHNDIEKTMPSAKYFQSRITRWHRYEDPSEVIRTPSYRNPLNYIELERQAFRRGQIADKRMAIYGVGIVICLIVQVLMIVMYDDGGENNKHIAELRAAEAGEPVKKESIPEQKPRSVRDLMVAQIDCLDTPPGKDAGVFEGKKVVEKPGMPELKVDEDGRELVATGTSNVPFFPKNIDLPTEDGAQNEEYHLLGLGIRTVFWVQVYVLGVYVRAADLPALQSSFVKHINSLGTSLIPQEKATLKQDLLDPEKGYQLWDKILRDAGVRSAVRIVPTRSTDFAHLRDGFVTGITQRAQEAAKKGSTEYDDEQFGAAIKDFKALFTGRGAAPKGSALTLLRDSSGALSMYYEKDPAKRKKPESLGSIRDSRIARQMWLGYLGGKKVSSEAARKNIVDGVLDLVERPVGTVGMEVV